MFWGKNFQQRTERTQNLNMTSLTSDTTWVEMFHFSWDLVLGRPLGDRKIARGPRQRSEIIKATRKSNPVKILQDSPTWSECEVTVSGVTGVAGVAGVNLSHKYLSPSFLSGQVPIHLSLIPLFFISLRGGGSADNCHGNLPSGWIVTMETPMIVAHKSFQKRGDGVLRGESPGGQEDRRTGGLRGRGRIEREERS